jgi:hypothetical protein
MILLNVFLLKSQEKNYKLSIILLYIINNKYNIFNLIKNHVLLIIVHIISVNSVFYIQYIYIYILRKEYSLWKKKIRLTLGYVLL